MDGQYDQVELARLSACLSASFQPTDSPQSSTQMNGDQRSVEGANIEGLEEEQPTTAVRWRDELEHWRMGTRGLWQETILCLWVKRRSIPPLEI